jgi:ATP-dependent protease HslVU (ClpYQ) peptidase subunit
VTVIAAAKTVDGGVTLAADSQTSSGWTKDYRDTPKLWVDGLWAIGGAGSLRTIQVLKHHVTWPRYRPDEDDWESFLVKEAVPALVKALSANGQLERESNVEHWSASLVVANQDDLAVIYGGGCVWVPKTRVAIGSGESEAYGFLGDQEQYESLDVIQAAERATLTNIGCSGDIAWVDTRDYEVRYA